MTLAVLSLAVALQSPTEGTIVAASLFKNGYAVVVRETHLGSGGKVLIKPPTDAVLGTLWISASKGVVLKRATLTKLETKGERDAESLEDLLTANHEKEVTLETTAGFQGQSTTVKGRLVSSKGAMVVLEQQTERLALFKTAIIRVIAAEHGLNFRLPTTTSERAIAVEATGEGKVYWVNLQRGMTWAPSYQVSLLDDTKLSLVGKATILNDLAQVKNVELSLVTGFPNMRFLNLIDPMSSGQSVSDFVQSLAYAATNPEFRREALSNQAVGGLGGGRFEAADQMAPTGQGEQLEDLFFYRVPGISLSVGERAYTTILNMDSAYKQEYEVRIPDTDWNSPKPVFGGSDVTPPDVWHTLKFRNTSGQPLTTAPAITMRQDEVLGQDVLNYTSAGSEVSLKVTKSLDIHVEAMEEETARERGALRIENRAVYDRVTVNGTVEIHNTKGKAVQMRVIKTATGEVTDTGGGEAKKTPAGLRSVNPVTQVVWTPLLQPGQTLRLAYKVSVLVPSAGY